MYVYKNLWSDHSNETSTAVLSWYYLIRFSSFYFGDCVKKPVVWRFKWNLSESAFHTICFSASKVKFGFFADFCIHPLLGNNFSTIIWRSRRSLRTVMTAEFDFSFIKRLVPMKISSISRHDRLDCQRSSKMETRLWTRSCTRLTTKRPLLCSSGKTATPVLSYWKKITSWSHPIRPPFSRLSPAHDSFFYDKYALSAHFILRGMLKIEEQSNMSGQIQKKGVPFEKTTKKM